MSTPEFVARKHKIEALMDIVLGCNISGVSLFVFLFGMIISTTAFESTYIANAFHDPIFVKVDSERAHIESISAGANLGVDGIFSVGGSYSKEEVWNKFIEVGFSKVIPRESFVASPESDTDTVYVTIWSTYDGFIWNNAPQPLDVSFLVKSNGAVIRSKYGNIWQDGDGNNLQPSQYEVEAAAAAAEKKREEEAAAAATTATSGTSNYGAQHVSKIPSYCFIFFSLIKLFYI